MVEGAQLEETETGLRPVSDGWFVVNVRDARWMSTRRSARRVRSKGRRRRSARWGSSSAPPGEYQRDDVQLELVDEPGRRVLVDDTAAIETHRAHAVRCRAPAGGWFALRFAPQQPETRALELGAHPLVVPSSTCESTGDSPIAAPSSPVWCASSSSKRASSSSRVSPNVR